MYDRWRRLKERRDGEFFRRNEEVSKRRGELSNRELLLHG
jgi:hypothetical protein